MRDLSSRAPAEICLHPHETRAWRASTAAVRCLLGLCVLGASGASAQPIPFEFGPDWRFLPPSEGLPLTPRERGRTEPFAPEPFTPKRRPEPRARTEAPPSEEALRAEALKKAMAPRPDPTILRREKLDALFTRLASATDPTAARRVAESIEAVWLRSGSDTADLLMRRALASLNQGRLPLALELFDKIVVLEPSWVEAWNRRAVARFKSGDPEGAMTDIDRVLKLEPRHFPALSTMGRILEQTGFEGRALEVFRRVQAIYPLLPTLRQRIDQLEIDVEGRGI